MPDRKRLFSWISSEQIGEVARVFSQSVEGKSTGLAAIEFQMGWPIGRCKRKINEVWDSACTEPQGLDGQFSALEQSRTHDTGRRAHKLLDTE